MNEKPLKITIQENGKAAKLPITWAMIRTLWAIAPIDADDGPSLAKGTKQKWVCDALVRRGLAEICSSEFYPEYYPLYKITRRGSQLLRNYQMHPADNIGRLLSKIPNDVLFAWVDIPS